MRVQAGGAVARSNAHRIVGTHTVIYLYEVRRQQQMPDTDDLLCYALKLATGTGKTVVSPVPGAPFRGSCGLAFTSSRSRLAQVSSRDRRIRNASRIFHRCEYCRGDDAAHPRRADRIDKGLCTDQAVT